MRHFLAARSLRPFATIASIVTRVAALIGFVGTIAGRAADDLAPGWWRDATFYEVFVRSFADASSGPLARDGIGDLQGLIEHLDYLNDGRGGAGSSLGVNALWLMPIQPSPSYHGYDVTDYFAVNPDYGDVALMKRFVAEAHRRGVRVIIDLVLNHASARHPWFQRCLSADPTEAASARKLFRFATVPEDVFGPWHQRVWHPAGDAFFYGVFSADMPDWNLRDPTVNQHHRDVAKFWLREVGVDGFRLDAIRYLIETGEELQDTAETRAWLRDFTATCHAIKPGAFIVGEDTADLHEVARCIRGGAVDSAFEFDLARATIEAVRLRTPGLLANTLQKLATAYAGDAPWATILTNHDEERARTQFADDEGGLRLATKLLFTLPGVPFVYYGEELGLRGAKPDPELRTPMPWTAALPNAGFCAPAVKPWHAVTPDAARWNIATESTDAGSMLALYRRLIRLNASSPALRHGGPLDLRNDDREVFATMRATDGEVVLVLANFGAAAKTRVALTLAQSPLRAGWTLHEEITDAKTAVPALDAVGGFAGWTPMAELPPESLFVIRWRRP